MRLQTREDKVRAALEGGRLSEAAMESFYLYGAEIFGFLHGVLLDRRAADGLYGRLQESVLVRLTRFEWRCSLRTWMYALARGELRGTRRFRRKALPAEGQVTVISRYESHITPSQKSSRSSKIAELRRALAPDDLELLILRIDRLFGWRDLAITQIGFEAWEGELLRESERLRVRFETIKERLTCEARARGILESR